MDFTFLTELTDLFYTLPFIAGYSNINAFKRILLKKDVHQEGAREHTLKLEAIDNIRNEQQKRQEEAFDQQVKYMGATLLLTGSMPLAAAAGQVGYIDGLYDDNVLYKSFVPDKGNLMGKFNMQEGQDAWRTLTTEAENLEAEQDVLKDATYLQVFKDLITADYSNIDDWWTWEKGKGFFPNIKDKIDMLKESQVTYDIKDFIQGAVSEGVKEGTSQNFTQLLDDWWDKSGLDYNPAAIMDALALLDIEGLDLNIQEFIKNYDEQLSKG